MGIPSDRQQLQQAVSLAKQGQKFEAINIVSDVLKNNQDNADAWILMAQLVDDQGRALECWRKAAQLRPDDARIQANIARLEPGFSPYLDGTTDAAVQAVVPQVRRRTQSRGSGCLTMFLLSLIVAVLLGVLYGVYLNSTSPGWLGERIYDQRLNQAGFNMAVALSDALLSFPDSDRTVYGNYEPSLADLLPATAKVREIASQLGSLETPEGRASMLPYVQRMSQACLGTADSLDRYAQSPNRNTHLNALRSLSPCQDAHDEVIGRMRILQGE